MIRWNIVRAANILLGRHKAGKRVADPAALYRDLISRGLVVEPSRNGAGRRAFRCVEKLRRSPMFSSRWRFALCGVRSHR